MENTQPNNLSSPSIADPALQDGYLGLGNIAETLEALSSVSLFLGMLKQKSCLNQFTNHAVHTLFAPSNDAMKKLGLKKQQLLEQSSAVFAALLSQLSSSQLMLMGQRHPISSPIMQAASSYIRIQNIPATNGVIHIIDNLKPFQIGN
jgi:hypothetical protein